MNADFEGGYAVDPEQVAANVTLAVSTGIAGLSIEDSTGDRRAARYDVRPGRRADRSRAAGDRRERDRRRADGRSEGFVVGRPDIDETVRRLRAYAEAGADCLYAPRIRPVEQSLRSSPQCRRNR